MQAKDENESELDKKIKDLQVENINLKQICES